MTPHEGPIDVGTPLNDQLSEIQSRLESIGKNFTAGVIYQVLTSPEGGRKFTYLSNSVQQMYGVTPEEGMRDASLIYSKTHPDDVARMDAAESEAIRNCATFKAEVRTYDLQGQVRWSSFVSTPNLLQDGYIRWDGIELDITEQKRLEEQLRQCQKLEAVGSLAGGVAHDFNNLLCVILGNVELAMEGVDSNDPILADLEQVKQAGTRAAALTRQLLAFSRKQVMQPAMLNLNKTITLLDATLCRILDERITFVQALEPQLGLVRADPNQIEQVLVHLAANARDAMPEGGSFTIATSNLFLEAEAVTRYPGLPSGTYVELTIADSGCGMDEQTKARVFEPFFTTKEVGKGTGLGLSMVYGVVEQSGGKIWVESDVGRGSTFRICLPVIHSELSVHPDRTPPLQRQMANARTILVVEDEAALRQVIRRALVAGGYQVLAAEDGDEALLVAAQHDGTIHLLLTDVVMPRMNGRVLADRLSLVRPEMKVVFMSGYSRDIIAHNEILTSDALFLAKPFTMTELTQKVEQVLQSTEELPPCVTELSGYEIR